MSLASRLPALPFVGVCLAVFVPVTTAIAADVDAEARSILTANCLKCHGPTKQKGGLRFDTRDGLLGKGDSGSPAVVPGKPGASELIRRVTATDATVRMPPGDDGPDRRPGRDPAEVDRGRGRVAAARHGAGRPGERN